MTSCPAWSARNAAADVIEHLVEIKRRRLFLDQACSSLTAYCIERLGYSEDEACKRVSVAGLASRLPAVLEELRAGSVHFTGLFLLAGYLNAHNFENLITEARGKTKRQIEMLLASRECAKPSECFGPAVDGRM